MKTRVVTSLFLVLFLIAFYLALDALIFLTLPASLEGEERTIAIPRGATFREAAQILHQESLLRSPTRFCLLARIFGVTAKIKAGEYRLHPSMVPQEILEKLIKGEVATHRVTIPEGFTVRQIGTLLEREGLITSQDEFLALAFSREYARKLGINADSLEGYLFPDTYLLARGLTAEQIIRIMTEHFKQVYESECSSRDDAVDLTDREVVILASIVEKETSLSEERALVSAVFHNRLKWGMPLCSDPTVIYGLPEFDGNLTKEDLETPTPYNTYLIRGLPAGPIANPGRLSLRAVLYPADVDYRYFVSRNDGSHVFSSSLKEHNKAVWKYQKRKGAKR